MGAAKSLPILGESVTVIESGTKLGAGVSTLLVGKLSNSQRLEFEGVNLIGAAGNAWVDYTDRNLIAGNIKVGALLISNNYEEARRVNETTVRSLVELGEGLPLVGHGIGVYHYIKGETEDGNRCMETATKGGVVIVAGVGAGVACTLTGGLAAPAIVAIGATATLGASVGYDGVATGIKSAVKQEYSPSGIVKSTTEVITNPNGEKIVDIALGIAANLASGTLTGISDAKITTSVVSAGEVALENSAEISESEARYLNGGAANMAAEEAAGNGGRAAASSGGNVFLENSPEIVSEAGAKLNSFELETSPDLGVSDSKMVMSVDSQIIPKIKNLAELSPAAKRILDLWLETIENSLKEQGYPLDKIREMALDHVEATEHLKSVQIKGPAVAEMIKFVETNEKHIGLNKTAREFLVEAKERPPNPALTDISRSELANRVPADQQFLYLAEEVESYDKCLKVLDKMDRRPPQNCGIYDAALRIRQLPEKYNVSSVIADKGNFTTIDSCHHCKVFGVKTVLPGRIPVSFSQALLREMTQAARANLQI